MWDKVRQVWRDWYILIIGFCLIFGGLYAASQSTGPALGASSAQQNMPAEHQSAEQKPSSH